jgi:hypothetical protein
MATATGALTAHTAIGLREDLADVIYEISPTETPFLSNVAHTTARAVLHEWQTDSLAAANTANAQLEGDVFSAPALTVTVRQNNRLQISDKQVSITGTLDAVDKAGRDEETSYQIAKAGRELKRDMEAILTGEHIATAGSLVSARALAACEAWIHTNVTVDATNTTHDTTAVVNSPSIAITDGTQTAIDETIFKSVIADCWTEGGNPGVIMAGAFNKQQISGFSGIATNFKNVPQGQATIVGAADLYVSDFGEHQIVPNRFMRARTVLMLDMDMWAVAFLRDIHQQDIAKRGDSTERSLVVEYTLVARNQAASGKLPDLTTS